MTREDIIYMAREADIDLHKHWNDDETNRLEIFAQLVAAAEREACAKLCEESNDISSSYGLAQAIRSRGEA